MDKFEIITEKLIKLMEEGTSPWVKPWKSNSTPYANVATGNSYKGVNPRILNMEVLVNGFSTPWFIGFNQAKDLGWKVIKGSKASSIVYAGPIPKKNEEGEIEKYIHAFKWMSVFNLDQVDDAGSKISKEDKIASWGGDPKEINERIQPVEEWVKSTGATIQHGGNTAAYSSSLDKIFMPHLEDFFTPEAYYSTLIHELVHWTGHNTRLDRKLVNQFGSEAYAFEELIAEIGSTSLGEELGINPDLKNHASYLNSWIKILKGDKKAFFKAASLAQKASEFLNK